MQIKVLGTGCRKCNRLYDAAAEVLAAEGLEAELIKVEDLQEIMDHGVLFPPGLVIDGDVKCTGKVPRSKQLARWFQDAAAGR